MIVARAETLEGSGILFDWFPICRVNHADKDRNHETEVPDSPTVAAPPREDSKMSLDTAVVNMATDGAVVLETSALQ
jgi:hypothetical protein